MNDLQKRTWAEISLSDIKHNYNSIRASLPTDCRFLGVVKADAYGHGALRVAHLLQENGADYLAVSCLDEALELRRGGITMPILILGHTPYEYTPELIRQNITQTVTCLAKAEEYSAAASVFGKALKVHIKVDSGMSRLGFLCSGKYVQEGIENIYRSCMLPHLDIEGIYTHFAVADESGEENRNYTLEQFSLFLHVINELKSKHGIDFEIKHCANSGAVVNYPEMLLDMVRPGLLLYGYGDTSGRFNLHPCMRFVTTVSTIKHYEAGTYVSYGRKYITDKKTRIGVLAVGYADGLPRAASGKFSFATQDGPSPQCGNICMDMCMTDLTGLPNVDVGSEIEIFGKINNIYSISDAAETIPYELLCSVTKRVPRVYL